jgi:hypothetical protein
MKKILSISGLALLVAGTASAAGFTPIALNPASYNHDAVIEASAPKALCDAVTFTMDGGTNKTGATWYERGYNTGSPTTGIPTAGSRVTNAALNHIFQMAPDYHVNNVIAFGHQNGTRTPVIAPGTLTLTTPGIYSGISVLTAMGGSTDGKLVVAYTIHYSDASTESGTFQPLDWFNGAVNVFNSAGRVGIQGGVQNVGANPAGAVFAIDLPVGNPSANVVSVDFVYLSAGNNGGYYNNGRGVIFAISGAKDNSTDYTNALAVTGYNHDAVVEADAAPTTGYPAVGAAILTNNITVTMDGGTNKTGNTWYEKGYYAGLPTTGIPIAGSTISSAAISASYTMPPTYVGNSAVVLTKNVPSANVLLATPASYGGLSFLCAAANGATFVPCTIQFQDGSFETNTLFVPDWFNVELPPAYISFGRVNPNNRTINSAPDNFLNPFALGLGTYDFRGLGLPTCRLFDAVITVTNTSGVITNIALTYTNGAAAGNVPLIFAVSGVAPASVPPVFGSRGTPTPGQPNNAPINAITLIKQWEGTNTILLSVTNSAGTGPISYQWKKAALGGGLRDIFYSFDYSTFANVANGGRISGATSSALVISGALTADSGDYLVVASNPYGSVTSTVVTVELLSTNQSILLGQSAGDVIAPIAADSTPGAESIDHVIDRAAQKWLSDGLQFAGNCCGGLPPFTGPVGFTVTPVSGASFVTSMRFVTANDTTGRDPFDYTLEGSNDGGGSWTRVTGGQLKGTLSLPTGRNGTGAAVIDPLNNFDSEVDFVNATSYKSYRVSITNNYNRFGDALMQVNEIELLGTFVPAPPTWVRQPEPTVLAYVGSSPSFVVKASGLGSLAPKYQWYRGGTTLIPGATSSAYALPNAQLSDSAATFNCVATNGFGSITSTISTLTVITAPTQPYPAAVLANNPIGFWRLNEADDGSGNNGAIAHDYRGGHNGSYSNVILQVNGYNPATDPDKAGSFGVAAFTDSYVDNIKDVDFSRATNTAGAVFSIEAWANGGNQTLDAGIVTKGYNGALAAGTGTGSEQFVLDVSGGNPRKFRFLVRDAGGNGYVAQSTAIPYDPLLLAPTWHHLLGVLDQPNGKLSLYVDGLLAATGTMPTNAGIITQPLPMTIGSRKSTGAADYDNQWNGLIDDVAVYSSALSSNAALAHFYAAQRPPVISLQPTNITTSDNVTVTFNSAAYGPGTLAFQWYLSDGFNPTTAVAGQTAPNLSFITTPAQNANNYQLIVTNIYGATTGAVAQLTVISGAPQFSPAPGVDLPATSAFGLGHIIQLHVFVLGTAPFTYQWQKNGVNIVNDYRTSGVQTDTLQIAYAAPGDSGNYQVIVTGSQGTTGSTVDAVTVSSSGGGSAAFTAAGTGWSLQGTPSLPIMGNNRLELTSGLGNTARSAFMTTQQGVASFNASFVYQDVSGNGGADGVTFCIQNAPAAAAAVGAGGGGLGYGSITPSVALALNIYNPNVMGIALLQNGAVTPPFSSIAPVTLGANNNPILITVAYGGGSLSATFKDTITLATFTTNATVNISSIVGGTTAYMGFTGADGGVSSTQVISNFTMSPPPVSLKATKVGNSLVLTWPASTGAYLKSTPSLSNPVTWSDVTAPFSVVGNNAQVTITPLIGNQFYRLEVYP